MRSLFWERRKGAACERALPAPNLLALGAMLLAIIPFDGHYRSGGKMFSQASMWADDAQTRNYAWAAGLSGSESRIPLSMYTSRTSLGLLRPGGHNSIHASISNGLAIVLIDMSKDPQVDPSDRLLLAEEIRGLVEFGSC